MTPTKQTNITWLLPHNLVILFSFWLTKAHSYNTIAKRACCSCCCCQFSWQPCSNKAFLNTFNPLFFFMLSHIAAFAVRDGFSYSISWLSGLLKLCYQVSKARISYTRKDKMISQVWDNCNSIISFKCYYFLQKRNQNKTDNTNKISLDSTTIWKTICKRAMLLFGEPVNVTRLWIRHLLGSGIKSVMARLRWNFRDPQLCFKNENKRCKRRFDLKFKSNI